MRAALYARVSTSEKEELQDPETQLVALRDYCRFRQWDIYYEYKEHASGVDDNRQVLRDMLDDAKAGKFDYILVFRIDRLTRSPLKLLLILEELQDPKTKRYLVNLVSATEGVDTSSRLSEGMLLMLGIFAKMERDGIQERVQAGMDRAKRYGTRSGNAIGRPRLGREVTGTKRKAVTEERILAILRRDPGISKKALAAELGIPRSTLYDYLALYGIEIGVGKEGGTPLISRPLENGGVGKEVVADTPKGGEGPAVPRLFPGK